MDCTEEAWSTRLVSKRTGMEAKIRVDGEFLEEIEVNNGLRQGWTMVPTLFNL